MDKKQESKIKMGRAVSAILTSYNEIVLQTPGLNEANTSLGNLLNDVQKHGQGQLIDGNELTKEKANIRSELETALKKVTKAMVAFATNSKDTLLKEKHRYSNSDIERMKDSDLFNTSYNVYGDALLIAKDLEPFATLDDVTGLKALADDFNNLLPQKRNQVDKRSVSTQNLEDAVNEISELLKDTMDPLMAPLEFTQPDFFKAYMNARIIVDPAYRKKKGGDNKQETK